MILLIKHVQTRANACYRGTVCKRMLSSKHAFTDRDLLSLSKACLFYNLTETCTRSTAELNPANKLTQGLATCIPNALSIYLVDNSLRLKITLNKHKHLVTVIRGNDNLNSTSTEKVAKGGLAKSAFTNPKLIRLISLRQTFTSFVGQVKHGNLQ